MLFFSHLTREKNAPYCSTHLRDKFAKSWYIEMSHPVCCLHTQSFQHTIIS
jgi:hypothetical protein